MHKKKFLILFSLFVTIKNCAMRQHTNAHKLVICNFCTQNHLKMAKICILRPKNATFVQSNHPGPLKHTFLTPPVCVLRPRKVKKSHSKKFWNIYFWRFWLFLSHFRRRAVISKPKLIMETQPTWTSIKQVSNSSGLGNLGIYFFMAFCQAQPKPAS